MPNLRNQVKVGLNYKLWELRANISLSKMPGRGRGIFQGLTLKDFGCFFFYEGKHYTMHVCFWVWAETFWNPEHDGWIRLNFKLPANSLRKKWITELVSNIVGRQSHSKIIIKFSIIMVLGNVCFRLRLNNYAFNTTFITANNSVQNN